MEILTFHFCVMWYGTSLDTQRDRVDIIVVKPSQFIRIVSSFFMRKADGSKLMEQSVVANGTIQTWPCRARRKTNYTPNLSEYRPGPVRQDQSLPSFHAVLNLFLLHSKSFRFTPSFSFFTLFNRLLI